MIGQMLGHYRILGRLGEGGMGVVYKALDTKLNRHVAIKLLPPELTRDPERRLRFQREAQAAAALSHPNIAVIHEVGEHEGAPFFVMEYLEGKTLRETIGERSLPVREWLRVALPVAEGLAHAHAHRVVHRDLKPDNVMITGEHQVKILDFGLAKLLEPPTAAGGEAGDVHSQLETISKEMTRAGKVFGTVAYMSPEQARGEPVDHRSDLFSLGVVLYQMASGRLPFKKRSEIETLHAIIAEEPPPLAHVVEGIPPDIERIVRKAIEKEPERRYQDAADLAADLRNLQRDLDSGRISAAKGSGPVTTTRSGARDWLGGRRGWGAAVAVVVVAGLLAGILYYWQARPPASGTVTPAVQDRAIGVIGFENLSDPNDAENLGRVLMSLITTDLAESGGLKVVSTPKVLAALRQAGRAEGKGFDASLASEAARIAGARVMLVGQVSQAGDRLLLTAELIDVESGNTLGSHKKDAGSKAELFSLAGAIASEVRGRMSVGPAGAAGTPSRAAPYRPFDLARALTSSPEAYRQYVAGELAFQQMKFAEAIGRFGRAVQEDPTFALAYYRLGVLHWWNGSTPEARAALQKGLGHVERLPERWQVVYRAFDDFCQQRSDASYDALTRLVSSSSDIPDAYYILGEIATHISRYQDHRKSREFLGRALEIDPTFKMVLFHLIPDYIAAEDIAGARKLLEPYREENPADPAVVEAETMILVAEGRRAEVMARAEELKSRGSDVAWLTLSHAHLEAGEWERAYAAADGALAGAAGFNRSLALDLRGQAQICRGHFRAGLGDIRAAVSQPGIAEVPGSTTVLGDSYLAIAQVLEATGDTDAAVAAARQVLRTDPFFHRGYFWLGKILLDAHRNPEAAETLSELQQVVRGTVTPAGGFWAHLLEAERHLSEGNVPAAKGEIDQASSLAPEHRDRTYESLVRARVLAAAGDVSKAIAAYREMSDPRYRYYFSEAILRIRALPALARLEERTGELATARQHYRRFLDCWGNADMPVAEVKEAKARLAALEGH